MRPTRREHRFDERAQGSQHALQVLEDLLVAHAHDEQSELHQCRFATLVFDGLPVMNGAVEFDHHARPRRVEVDDEPSQDMLSSPTNTEGPTT